MAIFVVFLLVLSLLMTRRSHINQMYEEKNDRDNSKLFVEKLQNGSIYSLNTIFSNHYHKAHVI